MIKQRGEGSTSGGIGFLGLLEVIFITLKILDVKPIGDWSWWWVTSPLWIGVAITLLVLGVIAAIEIWAAK